MSFVDDVIVKKLYACPVCFETFAKWGTCLIHLNSNVSRQLVAQNKLRWLSWFNISIIVEHCLVVGHHIAEIFIPIEA